MYERIVTSDTLICGACPVIYEGETRDGQPFYFRLRHGIARLVLEDTKEAAVMDAINGRDGVCSFEEYKEMFLRLYLEIVTAR